jgi:ATP-dependent DNA ligase
VAARRVNVPSLLAAEYRDRLRPGKAEFIAPMLATLTTSYFSDTGWLFERRLDGVRTLARSVAAVRQHRPVSPHHRRNSATAPA